VTARELAGHAALVAAVLVAAFVWSGCALATGPFTVAIGKDASVTRDDAGNVREVRGSALSEPFTAWLSDLVDAGASLLPGHEEPPVVNVGAPCAP
jgi:hypothetical protein